MSKRGEAMAAEYVTAVLASSGIAKAAGGQAPPGLLLAACLPLCEHIVAQEKRARRTARAVRRNQRVIKALAGSAPVASPSPMRLPARQQVDFRPQEWRTVLQPAREPLRNGYAHAAEGAESADYTPPGGPAGHAG